jgi:hypothetical protein
MPELHPSITETLKIVEKNNNRFLLVGSYGRAALLGDDIAALSAQYGASKRFQDIDVLDLEGTLRSKYTVPGAADFDTLLTSQYRPLNENSWGLFDRHLNDASPLVTIDARHIPTTEVDIPGLGTIQTFDSHGQLMMTHALDHMRLYAKHNAQVKRLMAMTDYTGSEADQAATEYVAKMREIHPIKGVYPKIAQQVFKYTPRLAVAISDSSLGLAVRVIRNSNVEIQEELDLGVLARMPSSQLD